MTKNNKPNAPHSHLTRTKQCRSETATKKANLHNRNPKMTKETTILYAVDATCYFQIIPIYYLIYNLPTLRNAKNF